MYGTRFSMGLLTTTIPWKLNQARIIFFHTPSSFSDETLVQLQHLVQCTLRKECVESIATEERIRSPTLKKGDKRIARKEGEEGRDIYKYTSKLHI